MALPDEWESEHIESQLLAPDWPEGQVFATAARPRRVSRAGAGILHGRMPHLPRRAQGEIDITGYPKEGGKLGDLGGVISITLFR